MIQKTILAILFICFTLSCTSKRNIEVDSIPKEINYIPYYLKVYEADSLYLIGKYDRSYFILDSLFKKYEPVNITGYYECGNYLVSAYLTKHTENISQKVREYYKKYGEIYIPTENENDIKNRRAMLNFSKITKKETDSLRAIYFKDINYDLRNTVIKMMERDQYYRTTEYNDLKMDSVSRLQFDEINTIFSQHGYPNKNVIGYDGFFDKYATIEAILIHLSSENKSKTFPKLMSYIKKGTCTPDVYAAVYDKNVLILQNKQYYGSYLYGKAIDTSTLLDKKNINSIRKSIGLPSLYYNEWREKYIN